MNVFLWVLQWALAALLVGSFVSMPYLLRRGMARRPVTAAAMAVGGLGCGVALVVPWLIGQARVLTPVAAGLVAVVTVFDSLTNRMSAVDVGYNIGVLLMAVTVAVGRSHDLRPDATVTLWGWAYLVGGVALLALAIAGGRYLVSSSVRWAQALLGFTGVLAGIRDFIGR